MYVSLHTYQFYCIQNLVLLCYNKKKMNATKYRYPRSLIKFLHVYFQKCFSNDIMAFVIKLKFFIILKYFLHSQKPVLKKYLKKKDNLKSITAV